MKNSKQKLSAIAKIKMTMSNNFTVPLTSGVYLYSQADAIAEQNTWHEDDPSKHIDFKKSKYWVMTDSGETPEGFDSAEELADAAFAGDLDLGKVFPHRTLNNYSI